MSNEINLSKEEYVILNEYIFENLKKENPFGITTSALFKLVGHDIQFSQGHKKLYADFIKYCNEVHPGYNVKSFYVSENEDCQFDIEFY